MITEPWHAYNDNNGPTLRIGRGAQRQERSNAVVEFGTQRQHRSNAAVALRHQWSNAAHEVGCRGARWRCSLAAVTVRRARSPTLPVSLAALSRPVKVVLEGSVRCKCRMCQS